MECLNESCTICLRPLGSEGSEIVLSCSHGYHVDCFKYWTRRNEEPTCPTCRRPLVDSDKTRLTADAQYIGREDSDSEDIAVPDEPNGSLEVLRESLTRAESIIQTERIIRINQNNLVDNELLRARRIAARVKRIQYSSFQEEHLQDHLLSLQRDVNAEYERMNRSVIPAMDRFLFRSNCLSNILLESTRHELNDIFSASDIERFAAIRNYGSEQIRIARERIRKVEQVREL